MALEDKDKADLLDRLAKAARQRFESRRAYEWQICFATWTAFGVGAGLVLNAKDWSPGIAERVIAIIVAVSISLLFASWAWARDWRDAQDLRTSRYWESALELFVGWKLHPKLRTPDAWPVATTVNEMLPDNPTDNAAYIKSLQPWRINTSWVSQSFVTLCFAILFAGAVCFKPMKSEEKATKITIESDQGFHWEAERTRAETGTLPKSK